MVFIDVNCTASNCTVDMADLYAVQHSRPCVTRWAIMLAELAKCFGKHLRMWITQPIQILEKAAVAKHINAYLSKSPKSMTFPGPKKHDFP